MPRMRSRNTNARDKRELQNVIERSVVLSNGPKLHVALPDLEDRRAHVALRLSASNGSEIPERARILQALNESNGAVGGENGAAARLGLKRTTLQSRMRKYNIARLFK
jgi:formate hydrogenlyase transcriptional activator